MCSSTSSNHQCTASRSLVRLGVSVVSSLFFLMLENDHDS